MSYKTIPYPPLRRLQEDGGTILKRTNSFHALIEVDITSVRAAINAFKQRTGETLSFTGYIAWCLARSVEKHPQAHALRNWKGDFVIFDEVDINILVEREMEGRLTPMIHVIRAANKKSLHDIHRDIRRAQKASPDEVSGVEKTAKLWKLFVHLPGFIRRFIWRIFFLNPHWIKQATGTVNLSAIGMAGKGGGWGMPNANLGLSVIVGGIAERPVLINGTPVNHEFLQMTFAFDHDIIDGAPAARFVSDLRTSIERAEGLEDLN